MFILVSDESIYNELYSQQNVDKQMKIILCNFVGYKDPENVYEASEEYENQVYFNLSTKTYYRCKGNAVSRFLTNYEWKEIEDESELVVFKNKEINWENFELSESLCSENELRFGTCESSVLKVQVIEPYVVLKDKWIVVTETLSLHTHEFQFGIYKIHSAVPTADREYVDITAYDAMYDIINSSAINWYNTILPKQDSEVTMKQFRTSFVESFGLKQKDITLANDDMIVKKTIQVGEGTEIDSETEKVSILKESSLSGLNVIQAICEINGCFGHIGRDGKFHYIYLKQGIQGLYPRWRIYPNHPPEDIMQSKLNPDSLYPQAPVTYPVGGTGAYISANYEDFLTKNIERLQIREKENDIGKVYPDGKPQTGENNYIIQDNFLVYGKDDEKLTEIAKNIFEKIHNVYYRPFECETQGNPCFEVGDPIMFSTRKMLVESYVLKRTLKGVQALRDSISATGVERYEEKVNSIHSSIIQLKGKTNTLERSVEETRSTIVSVEDGLLSKIVQTAGEITSTVTKNSDKWDTSGLNITISNIGEPDSTLYPPSKYNGKYYLDYDSGKVYLSNGSAWNYVRQLTKTSEKLSSEIKQTAEDITSTVSKATSKFDTKGYEVSLFGYVSPDDEKMQYKAEEHNGEYYLNQDNGKLYLSNGTSWEWKKDLELITSNLSSEIKQTAGEITSTVSSAMEKYEIPEWENITLFGYGDDEDEKGFPYEAGENTGKRYLNQNNGKVYVSTGLTWKYSETLKLITENLSSRISQTASSIDLSVDNGEKTAGITIKMKNEKGEQIGGDYIGTIEMNGLVTFRNLTGEEGETRINGALLETGTVNCNTLNGGEINGQTIVGSQINNGNGTFSVDKNGKMTATDASITGNISARNFIAYNKMYMQNEYNGILGEKVLAFNFQTATTPAGLYIGGQGIDDVRFKSPVSFMNRVEHYSDIEIYDKTHTSSSSTSGTSDYAVLRSYGDFRLICASFGGSNNVILMTDDSSNKTMIGAGMKDKSDEEETTLILRGNTVKLESGGAAVTSDERLKNSFKPLDEFDEVYMDIEPCAFKFNNGTSGRYHFGVKAQNIKDSLENHGFTTKDFGGFVQMSDNPDNEDYCGIDDPMGIIYTEFVMWNTHMIQKLYKKIDEQQSEIDSLKESVSFLMERILENG